MTIHFQAVAIGFAVLAAVGTVLYTYFSERQSSQYTAGPERPYQAHPPPPPNNSKTSGPSAPRRRRNGTRNTDSRCTICLSDLDRNIVTLTCTHEFHQRCIDVWFTRDRTCPLCRSYN